MHSSGWRQLQRQGSTTAVSQRYTLLVALQVSGDLVGGWTERVAMRRCLSPNGCLGASKGGPHFLGLYLPWMFCCLVCVPFYLVGA
jgi:hypothetical protein